MPLDILKSVTDMQSKQLTANTPFLTNKREFFDGTGIFWYESQRSIYSACTKWEECVNLAVDIFFSKKVLKISCARGLNKGRKLKETVPLCQPIVEVNVAFINVE